MGEFEMDELNHMDARIYVDAPISREELRQQIAQLLAGTAQRFRIAVNCGEIDVRRNGEFNEQRRSEFPDGFLFFPYLLEVNNQSEGDVRCRPVVARLLEYLWSQGFPAVAACDYEDELPQRGGFKSRATPWPQTETLVR